MARPLFISLDGIDGTGKTTQVRLLAAWLQGLGRKVTCCADPGGTALGDLLRQLLLHHRHEMTTACEALLFMASRAQLAHQVIRPALREGQIVLSDRFLLANVVYQGHAGGLDVEALWQAGRLGTEGLEPDLTLILDLPLEAARARRGRPADRLEQRPTEYHERVRAGFLAEAGRDPGRRRVIDAGGSVEEVQLALRREIEPLLGREGQ